MDVRGNNTGRKIIKKSIIILWDKEIKSKFPWRVALSRPLWSTRELIKNFPGEEDSPGPSGPPEGFLFLSTFL
jgi:hypothetical protein